MSSRFIRASGTSSTTEKSKKDPKDCSVFEPQQWRATVCKHCFRLKSQHPVGGKDSGRAAVGSKLSSTGSAGSQCTTSDGGESSASVSATTSIGGSPKEQRRKTPSPSALKKLERTGSAGRTSPSATAARAKRAEREANLKRVSSREKLDEPRRGSTESSPTMLHKRVERSDSGKSR